MPAAISPIAQPASAAMAPSISNVHLVFFIHGVGQQYEEYGNITHHGKGHFIQSFSVCLHLGLPVATIQKNAQDFLDSLHPDEPIEVKFIPIGRFIH